MLSGAYVGWCLNIYIYILIWLVDTTYTGYSLIVTCSHGYCRWTEICSDPAYGIINVPFDKEGMVTTVILLYNTLCCLQKLRLITNLASY